MFLGEARQRDLDFQDGELLPIAMRKPPLA
jgi:hypothetical protein